MSLADRVKELREKLEWNQATLAQKSGISQATISRIEKGKVKQPKMGQLIKLAEALGTKIDNLISDNIQMSFDDLLKDQQAQVVFRSWGGLSTAQKQQLAELVSFFVQKASKEGKKEGE